MRRQRVREIVSKYGGVVDTYNNSNKSLIKGAGAISREQEDDARFVSKYFDTVANKQYQ